MLASLLSLYHIYQSNSLEVSLCIILSGLVSNVRHTLTSYILSKCQLTSKNNRECVDEILNQPHRSILSCSKIIFCIWVYPAIPGYSLHRPYYRIFQPRVIFFSLNVFDFSCVSLVLGCMRALFMFLHLQVEDLGAKKGRRGSTGIGQVESGPYRDRLPRRYVKLCPMGPIMHQEVRT